MRSKLFLLALIAAWPASAQEQEWDNSGNSQLQGTYRLRAILSHVIINNVPSQEALTGQINFDGNGHYTTTATLFISSFPSGGTTNWAGNYSLSIAGQGVLTNWFGTERVNILVSNGILLGSGIDENRNNLLLGIRASSANTQTLHGSYSMAYMPVNPLDFAHAYASMAQFTADGAGSIGNVSLKTYNSDQPQPVTQTESGVTYTLSGGNGTIRFPTDSGLPLRGDKVLFLSEDGNFFVGGSLSGTDLFVGVRRATDTVLPMNGLYYSAGINHNPGGFDLFYGSFKAVPSTKGEEGNLYEHQRYRIHRITNNPNLSVDYTGNSFYPAAGVNDYVDPLSWIDYTVGRDAGYRIGIGHAPFLSLRVAVRGPMLQAPSSAPFIDPTGVINAASFAPFTAGIAPGELLAIFGKNLASTTESVPGGVQFPRKLGGVEVKMNGQTVSLLHASPTMVVALVPFAPFVLSGQMVVKIELFRDGVPSNPVTVYQRQTAPGIFTLDQSGVGFGAVRDAAFRTVNVNNPTSPNAAVQVYMTGLGRPLGNGHDESAITPSTNLIPITWVHPVVDGRSGTPTVPYLVPTLVALYQVNMTVPELARTGRAFLDIYTQDAITSMVQLPVAAGPDPASFTPHRR